MDRSFEEYRERSARQHEELIRLLKEILVLRGYDVSSSDSKEQNKLDLKSDPNEHEDTKSEDYKTHCDSEEEQPANRFTKCPTQPMTMESSDGQGGLMSQAEEKDIGEDQNSDQSDLKVKGDGYRWRTGGRVPERKKRRLKSRNSYVESTRREKTTCDSDLGRNGLPHKPNLKWIQDDQPGLLFQVNNRQLFKIKMDDLARQLWETFCRPDNIARREVYNIRDIMVESSIGVLPLVTLSTQKDTPRKRKIELPDINLDISALPATSSSTEKAEPCTSRTQSLDMNTLHFNVDQTSNSSSNECSNSIFGSEPGSRWIKRLKLAETSSHGKLNRFLTRVMEGNKPEPPASDKHHGKKSVSITGKAHHKSSEIQIGETSSVETKQECKDVTLSHSWIKRWRHKQNQKNPETLETCKLENSKLATDEYEKKQFPSIAAMALMGKAMSGFQQCKFQKKESFVVWNTKAFD